MVSWLKNFSIPPALRGHGQEALHHQVLGRRWLPHHQIVDVQIVIVLGIGDADCSAFFDHAGDTLLREGQHIERPVDLLAADLLRHKIQLAGETRICGQRPSPDGP